MTAILFLSLGFTGCASSPSDTAQKPTLAPVEAEFNVAPKQLVDRMKEILASPEYGLAVASGDKGVITTTFKDYPGDWHIARRWQEHTRFRIVIIPDWEEPTSRCRIQINEETEQRATGSQPWQPAPGLYRRERSQQLLDHIQKALSAKP
jgi:hypothetical protein